MSTTTKIVTGVDYVGIPTNDIGTAREFYETVLGLEASSVWQRPGDVEALGVEFETGTVTIALINCPGLGHPVPPNPRRSRCRSRTSPRRAPSWSRVGSRSSATRSTPASATWTTSRTPTATRSCCITATPPRAKPARSGRHFEHHVEVAVHARVGERDAAPGALEQQVDACVADAQVVHLDAVHPARKRGPPDAQRPLEPGGVQAEAAASAGTGSRRRPTPAGGRRPGRERASRTRCARSRRTARAGDSRPRARRPRAAPRRS